MPFLILHLCLSSWLDRMKCEDKCLSRTHTTQSLATSTSPPSGQLSPTMFNRVWTCCCTRVINNDGHYRRCRMRRHQQRRSGRSMRLTKSILGFHVWPKLIMKEKGFFSCKLSAEAGFIRSQTGASLVKWGAEKDSPSRSEYFLRLDCKGRRKKKNK